MSYIRFVDTLDAKNIFEEFKDSLTELKRITTYLTFRFT